MNDVERDYGRAKEIGRQIGILAARHTVVCDDCVRAQTKLLATDEPHFKKVREKALHRLETEQAALEREVEELTKEFDELRARYPEIPEPFTNVNEQRRLLNDRCSGKRLELGRVAKAIRSQKAPAVPTVPLAVRETRLRELQGEIRYYERLIRELDEQEAAAEADAL